MKRNISICEAIHLGILDITKQEKVTLQHVSLGYITIYPNLNVYLIHRLNNKFRPLPKNF